MMSSVLLLFILTFITSSTILLLPVSCFPVDIDDYEAYFEEEMDSNVSPTYHQLEDEDCISDWHHLEYDYSIYIDPTQINMNCSLQNMEKNITMVCSDINTALTFHRNSTAYVLASGANITHLLKEEGNSTFFESLSDVAFFGNTTTETARVECSPGAGLAFQNVERIKLQNIEFSNCGAVRPSTSKNFTSSESEERRVSLYFYNCTSVTMCRLTVQHSINAVGVSMYDTDGSVNVYHSSFVNNTVQGDDDLSGGGGGVSIEFSYCIPGDPICNSSHHQTTHNSNSNYLFFRSNFTDNAIHVTKRMKHVLPNKDNHVILEQGGGLALIFTSNAYNNTVVITGCQFNRNKALFGGGLYIAFVDDSIGNKVNITSNLFLSNECYQSTDFSPSGGAVRIFSLLTLNATLDDSIDGNHVHISSYFLRNYALNGGAISFSPANQKVLLQHTTSLRIVDSVFHQNQARIGAAIHLKLLPLIASGIVSPVWLENSTIQYNNIDYDWPKSSFEIGIGSVYSFQIALYVFSNMYFLNNTGTALAITETYTDFCNSTLIFSENSGDTGGAIALLESSYIIVNDNTEATFDGNSARVGGAIYNYDLSPGVSKSSIACFVRHDDPFLSRSKWNASFIFINNTSEGIASNSIFISSVYPCSLRNVEEDSPISEILLFCQPHWKYIDSNCTSQIETQGNIYKLRDSLTLLSSYPGVGFELPITVTDDLDHNITNSVGYTSRINTSDSDVARVDSKYAQTSGNYLIITGQENSTISLELRSSGSRSYLIRVDVNLQECPPGFHFSGGQDDSLGRCGCHSVYSYRSKLNCSMLSLQARIPRNYWIGLDPANPGSRELVMSLLPNLYTEKVLRDSYDFVLPHSRAELDESVCGIRNRTGLMCGKCKENYSTAINSYDFVCTLCNDETNFLKNIVLYIVFAYLPYIIFLGGIVYFNLKFTSSAVTGFILFAQMISIDVFDISGGSSVAFTVSVNMYRSYHFVYGIFNFNSFANVMNPFCIGKNLTTLDILSLEYALAALPILIIGTTLLYMRLKRLKWRCCMWCISKGRKNDGDRPILHAVVAFTLLSYTKLSIVSMKILATHVIFGEDGHAVGDLRVFLAGHLSFSSKEYLFPYGILAIFFMVLVLIPPLFLLGLNKLIDRLLDQERFACLRKVWPTLTIHVFLDAFQGYYKPNRRFFAGVYFLFRLFITFSYIYSTSYLVQYSLQQVSIVIMISLLAIFKPYKREIFNVVDILIFLNLFFINTITTYVYSSSLSIGGLNKNASEGIYAIQYCLLWLPLGYMLAYIFFKILVKIGLYQRIVKKFQSRRLNRSSSQYLLYSNEHSEVGYHSVDGETDSLSDVALFKRAADKNRFQSSLKEQHTKSLVSILSGEEEEIKTGSFGIGTASS